MAEEHEGERLARRWDLVATHRDRLLRVVAGRTASAADAEDIVHEAFVRCVLFEGLDEERIGQFLTSVAIRLCADAHRRNGRTDRLAERLAAQDVEEETPEERICDAAEARAVAAVYETLPERQRSVVAARSEGMSCGQVARRLGLTYGAVESALARARAAVRARAEVCLDATALGAARCARAFRAVPSELPGISAAVLGGLLSAVVSASPALATTTTMPHALATPVTFATPAPAGPTPTPLPAPGTVTPVLPWTLKHVPRTPEPSREEIVPGLAYFENPSPSASAEPPVDYLRRCAEYGVSVEVSSEAAKVECNHGGDAP